MESRDSVRMRLVSNADLEGNNYHWLNLTNVTEEMESMKQEMNFLVRQSSEILFSSKF